MFVNRYDGHMALANSYVLKMAGITKDSPDPPGGTIVKDPRTGEPTGILKDEAMSAVYRHMPDASGEEMEEAALLALAEARKFGLTSIQDMSIASHVKLYRRLHAAGKLSTGICPTHRARKWRRLLYWRWRRQGNSGSRASRICPLRRM
ncbi:MAG: hypothetical protein A2X67_02410 [Ignavibacteria bacterium GWA2_55_11]|nr:MAG: hypothetical protein A2X67_02410 [Ignavibacteria bacterium GWA2_55_11]